MIYYSTRNIMDFPKGTIVVNAANAKLRRGAGVCGAIFAQADVGMPHAALENECKNIIKTRKKPIPVGSSVVTSPYGCKASAIIHAVGPIYQDYLPGDAKMLLAKTYLSIMKRVPTFVTVVIPAISCGIYGFPISEACKIAVNTLTHYQIMNWKEKSCNIILNAYDPRVQAEYINLGIPELP